MASGLNYFLIMIFFVFCEFGSILLNHDSSKKQMNRIKYQLKKPVVTIFIPSSNYYVYMLGKIII